MIPHIAVSLVEYAIPRKSVSMDTQDARPLFTEGQIVKPPPHPLDRQKKGSGSWMMNGRRGEVDIQR